MGALHMAITQHGVKENQSDELAVFLIFTEAIFLWYIITGKALTPSNAGCLNNFTEMFCTGNRPTRLKDN